MKKNLIFLVIFLSIIFTTVISLNLINELDKNISNDRKEIIKRDTKKNINNQKNNNNIKSKKVSPNLLPLKNDLQSSTNKTKDVPKNVTNKNNDDNKSNNTNNKEDKSFLVGNNSFKWKLPILYKIVPPVNEKIIDKGIRFLMKQTCIKFKKVPKLTKPGLRYFRGKGCWSYIGKDDGDGGIQDISIGSECEENWVIHHETLHALGVHHELSRKDRDSYIKILFKNVEPESYHNFNIAPSFNTHNLRFDFGSVMLYNRYAFSKNEKLTLIPNNHYYLKTLGQSVHASFNDLKLVNKYYCDDICKTKLKCLNDGYTNPKNCNICKCPRFYKGKLCEKLRRSQKLCPKQHYIATSNFQILHVRGPKKCYFKITTANNFKIKMILVSSNLPHSDFCLPHIGLEIKFLKDKGLSGVIFCGKDKNKTITSKENDVTMYYAAFKKDQFFKIKYKRVLS